ncbi:MAG: sulfatase, partial [Lacipirellulaceae bacterium]
MRRLQNGFAFFVFLATASPLFAETPNILWIISDDQSNDMGAYGTPAVSTPRLDQLAAEGVLYHNAYTTAPVCSASRTAMMTGMYQTSLSRAMHHRPANASKLPLPSGVEPISKYFRDQGYFVGNAKPDFSGNGKLDMNFADKDGTTLAFSDLFDGNDWRQAGSQPWFMQVNIFEPHRPFRLANQDLNRRNQLALPADMPDHPLARADYADYLASIESADAKVGAVLDRLAADGLADNTIVFFFSDNGREFTRAKGSAYDPGFHVPLVARVPEALRQQRPDLAPGTQNHQLVSMLDVTAATLAAAGIDLSANELDHLAGNDLLSASYTGNDSLVMANDRSSNAAHRSRVVRSGNLAYIKNIHHDLGYFGVDASWYSKQERPVHTLHEVLKGRGLVTAEDNLLYGDSHPEEELYDLAADPHQLNNLIDDPTYATQLTQLRGELDQWTSATGDRGGEFDPDLLPGQNWYRNTGRFRHLDDKNLPRDTTDYEYLQWWADQFNVPLDLEEGEFDRNSFWLPNRSLENTSLADGGYSGGTPQGWTDATPGGVWVQNLRSNQLTAEAVEGGNTLQLNSGGAEVRWAIDDNWGNLLEAG